MASGVAKIKTITARDRYKPVDVKIIIMMSYYTDRRRDADKDTFVQRFKDKQMER